MADHSKPTTTSLYTDFVTELDNRFDDVATLLVGSATNLPVGAIKFDRANAKFQEWDGAAFQDRPLGLSGGGTGATTASGARTALGLGTIATQNASAVAITGGSASGLTALGLSGSITFAADDTYGIGTNAARPQKLYLRSGLVIPVGTDKFLTS